MEAVSDTYRRQLLLALAEANPRSDTTLDPLEHPDAPSPVDEGVTRPTIEHVHLPKLTDLGYVTRDEGTGELSKGPNWSEVEPYLPLLREIIEVVPEEPA